MGYFINISARLPLSTIDEIDKLITEGKYKNKSKAITILVQYGLQLHTFQEMQKDPDRFKAFQEKIKQKINTEQFDSVLREMTDAELEGVAMMVQIEKERKHKQQVIF